MELTANEGFAVNSRRGTGHVFNSEAFEKFLKYHHLSHFIRAHEVAQSGVFVIKSKCWSVMATHWFFFAVGPTWKIDNAFFIVQILWW